MAWIRVQGKAADNGAGGTTIAVTLDAAVTSGNAIVGFLNFDADVNITSVTDDKSNTYNLETRVYSSFWAQSTYAFSLTNITNAPSIITVNFGATVGNRVVLVEEFSGGSTASTDERDGTAHGGQWQSAPGTGADQVTSGTFTTATNGDLIWGVSISEPFQFGTATAGTSFSAGGEFDTGFSRMNTEYRTQATAGSGTAATFTQAANDDRFTWMLALKPAAGVGDTSLMGQACL